MSAGQPLISVDELAVALEAAAPPALLDVRWRLGGPPGFEEYRRGHIPGAVYIDLDTELAGRPGPGGRHPLPEADVFGVAMRGAGVSSGRGVVVYDAADSMAAARAWWLLRYFGHRDVRVLDGGYRAWASASRPVSTEDEAPDAGDFQPAPGHLPLLDADGAARLASTGVLLDARAAERFRGETEPIDATAGHIPGAVNVPAAGNVIADGRFRDPADLAARFDAIGERDVGVYCGSGVTAAHEVLALELAGIPAALYIGSWSNWITDPSRPIATGDPA
jgi:thiosulfate/3-mercaptopyruvate sulfurtransferase